VRTGQLHPSHPIMRRLGADLEEKREPVWHDQPKRKGRLDEQISASLTLAAIEKRAFHGGRKSPICPGLAKTGFLFHMEQTGGPRAIEPSAQSSTLMIGPLRSISSSSLRGVRSRHPFANRLDHR
jgi:hypothetical protein